MGIIEPPLSLRKLFTKRYAFDSALYAYTS